jgi:TPR repeat protein
MYAQGKGTTADMHKALHWTQLAAASSDPLAHLAVDLSATLSKIIELERNAEEFEKKAADANSSNIS